MDDEKNASSSKSSGNRRRKTPILFRLGLFFLAVFTYQAWRINEYPKTLMTPPQAEIAVVLGAKTKGNVPTPVFQGRIEYALQLYREGKVRRLLFTGAPGDPPQALVAKRIAMEQGVPESAILVETRSTRTLENLRLAKELFPEITRQPVLLISDPLHLRRAIQIAGDLGLNAVAAPTPTTRIRSRRSRIKFTIRETFAYLWYQIERRLRN